MWIAAISSCLKSITNETREIRNHVIWRSRAWCLGNSLPSDDMNIRPFCTESLYVIFHRGIYRSTFSSNWKSMFIGNKYWLYVSLQSFHWTLNSLGPLSSSHSLISVPWPLYHEADTSLPKSTFSFLHQTHYMSMLTSISSIRTTLTKRFPVSFVIDHASFQ